MKSANIGRTALIVLGLCIAAGAHGHPAEERRRTHDVYFEHTDHELHVYRIYGDAPGKTLMIIGGIQGDEAAGYLAADRLVDVFLDKGNLILVPRANFPSIMLDRRQINEDMNRKFGEDRRRNYETDVVDILKALMVESDCVLNLHEGSGFYSETWEGPYRNPMRFGQCIIPDTDVHALPGNSGVLDLETMARTVIAGMNDRIENPAHRFRFNNHRTRAEDSPHSVQRASATYYALYTCGIPAFGIESAKSLPLETKVRDQLLAIRGFMDLLGIVPGVPGVHLDPPRLDYAVVAINDEAPALVENGRTLWLHPGDFVTVSHVAANYRRGLSVDIVGHGTLNDLGKRLAIHKPTRITVRRDSLPFGNIYLAMHDHRPETTARPGAWPEEGDNVEEDGVFDEHLFFHLRIEGEEKVFRNNDGVVLIRGDTLRILDVIRGGPDSSKLVVNFKGFVGDPAHNTGEDRGYDIDTGADLWTRYSLNREGRVYRIVVTDSDRRTVGILHVELEEPVFEYAVFLSEGQTRRCFKDGETIRAACGRPFALLDLVTNVGDNRNVRAVLIKEGRPERMIGRNDTLALSPMDHNAQNGCTGYRIEFRRDLIPMGALSLTCETGGANDNQDK